MSVPEPFSVVFKQLYRSKGLTQLKLHERTSYSAGYIKKLGQGSRHPPRETIDKLAAAIGANDDERDFLRAAAERDRVQRGARVRAPIPGFIGREEDVAAITRLLHAEKSTRLVTLIGWLGVGKTQLALKVAESAQRVSRDGSAFVTFSAETRPDQLPFRILRTLGLEARGKRPVIEVVSEYLRERRFLLVLDNMDALLAAAPMVAQLQHTCPTLRIVVTSRERLGIEEEQVYRVRPLPLGEATTLFCERATRAGAIVPDEDLQTVERICQRLERIPLAICTVAPEMSHATARELLAELPHFLGPMDDAIRWSYQRLEHQAQRVFRRFAVFAGGCTKDAATAVCTNRDLSAADLTGGIRLLLQKSMIERTSDGRLVMPEPVREYALKEMRTSGEAEAAERAHAEYFLHLAETSEPTLIGPDQMSALDRLEQEHDNMRAALRHLLNYGEPDTHGALRLAGALGRFWKRHGHFSDGRAWLDEALRSGGPAPLRAKALSAAGDLAFAQGDYTCARTFYEEALQLRRDVGDTRGTAGVLNTLGTVFHQQSEYERARTLYEESLRLRGELDDEWGAGETLTNLGILAEQQGRYDESVRLHQRSLKIRERLRNQWGIASSLLNLGAALQAQGDHKRARTQYNRALALFRELHATWGIAMVLGNLGALAHDEGDQDDSRTLHQQGLRLFWSLGDKTAIAETFEGLAAVAAAREQEKRAARLWGAAEAVRAAIGAAGTPKKHPDYERLRAAAEARGEEPDFAHAWQEGWLMPLKDAVAYALTADES